MADGKVTRQRSRSTTATASSFDSLVPPGDYTINTSLCPIKLVRPKGQEGPMIGRFLPCPDFDDVLNNLTPGRTTRARRVQSEWIWPLRMANFAGIAKGGEVLSWVLYHPDKEAESRKTNPFEAFLWPLYRANKAVQENPGAVSKWKPEWAALFARPQNKSAPLSPPETTYNFCAALIANGKQKYVNPERSVPFGLAPEDPLVLCRITNSVGSRMLDLLDRPKHDDVDFEMAGPISAPYFYGDPCGIFDPKTRAITGGLIFYVTDQGTPGMEMPKQLHPNSTLILPKKQPAEGKKTSRVTAEGYECAFMGSYTVPMGRDRPPLRFSASLPPQYGAVVLSKSKFILESADDPSTKKDSIIRIEHRLQQAEWVCRAYRPAAAAIAWAWESECPDLLQERAVQLILRASVSAVVPGPVPGANANGQGRGARTPQQMHQEMGEVVDQFMGGDAFQPTDDFAQGDEFGGDAGLAPDGFEQPAALPGDEFGGGSYAGDMNEAAYGGDDQNGGFEVDQGGEGGEFGGDYAEPEPEEPGFGADFGGDEQDQFGGDEFAGQAAPAAGGPDVEAEMAKMRQTRAAVAGQEAPPAPPPAPRAQNANPRPAAPSASPPAPVRTASPPPGAAAAQRPPQQRQAAPKQGQQRPASGGQAGKKPAPGGQAKKK